MVSLHIERSNPTTGLRPSSEREPLTPRRNIVNTTIFVAVSALLAASLNVVWIDDARAQSFADSTGGSSQAHGELVTHAGRHRSGRFVASAQADRARYRALRRERVPGMRRQHGGNSAARVEFLLDHANASYAATNHLSESGRFQPFPDSTGGSSVASAERGPNG